MHLYLHISWCVCLCDVSFVCVYTKSAFILTALVCDCVFVDCVQWPFQLMQNMHCGTVSGYLASQHTDSSGTIIFDRGTKHRVDSYLSKSFVWAHTMRMWESVHVYVGVNVFVNVCNCVSCLQGYGVSPSPLWCAQTARTAWLRRAESSGCTFNLHPRLHTLSAAACNAQWTNTHLWLTSHYRTQRVIVWNSEPLGCTDSQCSLIKCTIKQLWGFMTAPPDHKHIHSQCCLWMWEEEEEEGGRFHWGCGTALLPRRTYWPLVPRNVFMRRWRSWILPK